jgi:UDP-N-acetylmuramate dehydrogenase
MNMNMKSETTVQQISQFRDVFGEKLQIGVMMSRYTSARVGGPADMFLVVESALELQTAVSLAYTLGVPTFILGGGSNILVSDAGVRGLIIMNKAKAVKYRHSGAHVVCVAESGMNFSSLARQCIAKGLGGLEWAIGVPGTVGGAVVGNSGAHGGDMNSNVLAATVWEPGHGARVFTNEEMQYAYRDSILKREQDQPDARRVVLTAELKLTPEPVEVLMARADGFTAKRKQTQPAGASVGSMFKNPDNYYAGYLIESAGLKGFRVGGAKISEKHANFFVNDEDATADDIRALFAEAWNSVRERFGIEMDLEVELVGEWEFQE